MTEQSYRVKLFALHRQLGIPLDYEEKRKLPLQFEAENLASIGPDRHGRERQLIPAAAEAWIALRSAAIADGMEIILLSAFRSVENQAGEIQRRLDRGEALDRILTLLAAPGFSQHHTGRAVDIVAPSIKFLDEEFERTEEFRWMSRRAKEFGFSLSYPRENPHKLLYEPWHWCYREEKASDA